MGHIGKIRYRVVQEGKVTVKDERRIIQEKDQEITRQTNGIKAKKKITLGKGII
jgi:hypothetical protein